MANLPIIQRKQERKKAAREANQNSPEVNEAVLCFSDHIHLITPGELSKLEELVTEFGLDTFKAAVLIMKQRGGKSMKYLEKILKDPKNSPTATEPEELSEEVIRRVLA